MLHQGYKLSSESMKVKIPQALCSDQNGVSAQNRIQENLGEGASQYGNECHAFLNSSARHSSICG